MLSDLPKDMAEEVLSKLPVTSLRRVRFTCKNWNNLSRNRSIGKAKEAAKNKEFQVVMMLDYRVYLFSVNLLKPCIEPVGKLISLDYADRVDISNISHCDGLLFCITKDLSSLVVWNPWSGQTRWIQPRNPYPRGDRYALGYERINSHLKVLRFVDTYDSIVKQRIFLFEIYNFLSDSWKVVDVNSDWSISYCRHGLSLKGNTYWFAQARVPAQGGPNVTYPSSFLICFDFTTERFGLRLPLPFYGSPGDTVTLSSVRETQLAVLFQKLGTYTVKIWISSKIEPNAVSWNMLFLKVNMKPLTGFQFHKCAGSFFIDQKKKMAVILDKDRGTSTRNIAYIIGKKGYFNMVDLGESRYLRCWPLVCSYVPTSLQIKQAGNHNLP